MTIQTTTHINFRGDARRALEFYHAALGGNIALITYGQMGATDAADEIVWGQVETDAGFRVMAYDVPAALPFNRGDDPFFVSIRGTEASEISELWEKLAAGSTVKVPLAPSEWAPLYGMLTDPFGITWVVDVAVPYAG